MRRLHAWITGAAGGLAAYRFLRRRGGDAEAEPEAGPDPRAEELRAKLAETRAEGPAVGEPGAQEAPAEEPAAEAAEPESIEERRLRVHEEGRAAIDEMQAE